MAKRPDFIHFSIIFGLLLLIGGSLSADLARAEALNTTSLGLGTRKLDFRPATGESSGAVGDVEKISDELSGLAVCNRVSAPSSLFSLEIAAGGCMHLGGENSFAHSMGGFVMVLYYPFSARRKTDTDDLAVRMNIVSFTNLYLLGLGGFSKITRGEKISPVSYTIDTYDAGIGGGYSYRLLKYVAFGVEGAFVHSSSLSTKVATGSSSLMLASAIITVFL